VYIRLRVRLRRPAPLRNAVDMSRRFPPVEYKGYIHRVQKVSQNVLKYLVQNMDDYEKNGL